MKHDHCLAPGRGRAPVDAAIARHRYGRLFPSLPPCPAEEEFLFALGRSGGICDCGDADDAGGALGTEAAGWPFFGQFIAHDITADRSALRAHVDAARLTNVRSPQLDLECLYGDGPVGHPFLYERIDPAKLLLGPGGKDVQRNYEGIAVIGDPRNDSHVLMSQMHVAFARAHNRFVDRARQRGIGDDEVYAWAVRETRWHYQSAILHEFLPSLISAGFTRQLLEGDVRYYRPNGQPFIPLEFADAAYRYGHGQIVHKIRLNRTADPVPIFPDLLGFRPVPPQYVVEWSVLFDAPGSTPAERAKRLDGRLVRALIELPVAITGNCEIEEYHSLAVRDLQRGHGVALPSGETLARHMGIEPLTPKEVGAGRSTGGTPLWYYILREADVRAGGNRLGPVAARIVGEVLVGLLQADRSSVRYAPEDWRPTATLVEMLTA